MTFRGKVGKGEQPFSAGRLHCLTTSEDLENDLEAKGKNHLSELMDLPPSYGGAGLQSLVAAVDEEYMGSFA